ncbi:hypothetical protein [Nodosilinea nodulosa]|uniref:hypothetical protein n=1 Tax=Nodosilinea nodulosa TaxID=416001 RepID=UPI00030ED9FC|nr:hypothetical protein [Nodosilinea nodulosa]
MTYGSLAALTAEQNTMSELKALRAKPIYFDLAILQNVAADCIPSARIEAAEFHLNQIFGELEIPPTEYLDLVFGLDAVILYLGHVIGLDITLNDRALAAKARKQAQLATAYKRLGLDLWGVIHITPEKDIRSQLSAIIRNAA